MYSRKNQIIKKELVKVPLIMYFVSFALYLFLENIVELKEYALLVKPIIIPAIAFLYLTGRKSKRTILNLTMLVFIFIADNCTLLEDRSFYLYATMLYMGVIYIILYYAILDFKYVNKKSPFARYLGFGILLFVFSLLFYWVFCYDHADKSSQVFIVLNYIVVFVITLLLSMVNYILNKRNNRDLYLMLTLFTMFFTGLFSSINHYYMSHLWLVIIACIVEIPVYYFLLKYLIARDQKKLRA